MNGRTAIKSPQGQSASGGRLRRTAPKDSPPLEAPIRSEERLFYKISQVSAITGLESYILRYWETEFPFLHPRKSRGGQRVYLKKDVELILRIKQLLYEEGYTIAGARKVLGGRSRQAGPSSPPQAGSPWSQSFLLRLRADLKEILRILSSD